MTGMKTFLMPDRRRFLKMAGATATASLAAPYIASAQSKSLYINTWGGPWQQAAMANLIEPFSKETGIQVKTVSPVSFAKLAQQVKTGTYEFDVTTLGAGELVRANQAGILAPLTAPYEGGMFQNGIGSHAFATLIGYRKDKFPNGGPQNWADFWDVQKFPGGRSLQRYPARILPIALLADGVAVKDLYPLDIDRAFKSLDKIKPHIRVWWTAGAQAMQILRDGEVDMIGIWHGNYFEAEDAKAPVGMTWNQAEIERSYWVVAKGTPNMDNAKKFIEFATSAKPLAGFVSQANYGPLNPAANQFVAAGKAKRSPTAPENYALAFEQDIANFGADQAKVAERFEEWLSS